MNTQTQRPLRARGTRKTWWGVAGGIIMLIPITTLILCKSKPTPQIVTMDDASQDPTIARILDRYQTFKSMKKFGYLLVAVGISSFFFGQYVSAGLGTVIRFGGVAALITGAVLIVAAIVTHLRADRIAIDNELMTVEGALSDLRFRPQGTR